MAVSTEKLNPEQSAWGWKMLLAACIFSVIFMSFFYLAITSDPEYMPSHQQSYTQNAFNSAPMMSQQSEPDAVTPSMQMQQSMHDSAKQ